MIKAINNFLDRRFEIGEAIMLVGSFFGFVWIFETWTKLNIRMPLGIIFLSIGIYGLIRQYKKKWN